ncbi:C39 family peptidase [Bacillus sp. FSL R10-2780]|uniref:C39 family peptidase n=1 Tax=Bacillus sp. FSL R10-2780 TaxID=2954660 RepID=UPI0030F8D7CF
MKIAKIATTGIIALGSLTFPSSSLAEIGNTAATKVEVNQNIKNEIPKELPSKLDFVKQKQKKKDLLQLQDYLKQQEKLYADEDKLKAQQSKVVENTVEDKELSDKFTDLNNKQEKLQKEIQIFKEGIQDPIDSEKTVEVDKQEGNKVETEIEKDKEQEAIKKREENKKDMKIVEEKLQELKAKEEAELKAKTEQGKKESEQKAKEDSELKAKEEAELKAKTEQGKKESEQKAKEDSELKAKQEAELKAIKEVEEVKSNETPALSYAIAQEKRIPINRDFYTYNEPSLSSGISSGYSPQYVTVVEERPDGWVKIKTYYGDKWLLLNDKKLPMNKNFFTYNEPSLSSGVASSYSPQTVTVVEERPDGWVKIKTHLGHKWILPNEKKIPMNKNFFTYNEPSLSSGILYEYSPQSVTVVEERTDGWVRISTHAGHKWVLPNEKRVVINKNFKSYDRPSRAGNELTSYGAQTVTVVEEKGAWMLIRTHAGLQWVTTEEETKWIHIPTVFFAYDNPRFSSNVAMKFASQNVRVINERADGWVQIVTGVGDKWINKNTLTNSSVILDVPSKYQYPELYNGCEAVSLQMLVEYHTGRTFNKVDFAQQMPKDTTPMVKQGGRYKTWGDPDVGFVGDVTGKKPGYAINPTPLKRLLDQYAKGTNLTGHGFSVLENYVRNGKPVVVWVTEGLTTPNSPVTWKTPQGKTIYAKFNTHAVTLTGVDSNYVYYNDPITGQKNVRADKSWFENIYNQMGKKALSID